MLRAYSSKQGEFVANGWAVDVTMGVVGGGTSTQIYYAHVPDPKDAEEAVRTRLAATPDVKVRAIRPIPHNALI